MTSHCYSCSGTNINGNIDVYVGSVGFGPYGVLNILSILKLKDGQYVVCDSDRENIAIVDRDWGIMHFKYYLNRLYYRDATNE